MVCWLCLAAFFSFASLVPIAAQSLNDASGDMPCCRTKGKCCCRKTRNANSNRGPGSETTARRTTLWVPNPQRGDPALSIPPKDLELTDTEIARIKVAIEGWNGYAATADRRWLEPLIQAIFVP